jgi:hypothetical protein
MPAPALAHARTANREHRRNNGTDRAHSTLSHGRPAAERQDHDQGRPEGKRQRYSSRPVAGSASVDSGAGGTATRSGNGGGVPPNAGHSA